MPVTGPTGRVYDDAEMKAIRTTSGHLRWYAGRFDPERGPAHYGTAPELPDSILAEAGRLRRVATALEVAGLAIRREQDAHPHGRP